MNCLSLHQPWASAIEVGLKSIETRSWKPPEQYIGKPLAIAAAKRDTPELRAWWRANVLTNETIRAAFAAFGYHDWVDLPNGKVVCETLLVTVWSTNDDTFDPPYALATDKLFGDFSPNRYGWFLKDRVPVRPHVPVLGRQGLFQWEKP